MRSALAAEAYRYMVAFDSAYMIAADLEYTHENMFGLFMFTDSLQLYRFDKREKNREAPTYD